MIVGLIDSFYRILDKLGYLHPIHAPLTHFPIGGVVFVLILAILALWLRNRDMAKAARYSLVLALVFTIPTIITGFMDWQYFYAGAWLFEIKAKLLLAGLLLVLLVAALYVGRRGAGESVQSIVLYTACFVIVSALGYFGGNLVFPRHLTGVPQEYKSGQRIFEARCSLCHPHGGNIFNAKLPLRGAPELKDFNSLLKYLRDPVLPDGSRGQMPAFPPSSLSDGQGRQLYDYLMQVLLKGRT